MSHHPHQFRFEATNAVGQVQKGVITADSESEASADLQRRGLFSLSLVEETSPSKSSKVGRRDQALGLRTLATLLEAGIPLSRIPTTYEVLAPRAWAPVVEEMRVRLREGRAFAASLHGSSLGLPTEVVEIIRAGESAGQLASAVSIAATEMETRVEERATLLGALAYPLILALTAACSVALLVGVVLPRFARILAEAGGALPPSTASLLFLAETARTAFLPVALLLIGTALVLRRWVHTDEGRRTWHRALLRTPALGAIRCASATSRFCGSLAALLRSGTPLGTALKHAAPASGDAFIAMQVDRARDAVIAGASLSQSFRAHPGLAESSVRLIQVGEASGELVRMLSHSSRIERERAQMHTKQLMRLVEPILILFFGGLVAFIAAALLQALYSLTPGA